MQKFKRIFNKQPYRYRIYLAISEAPDSSSYGKWEPTLSDNTHTRCSVWIQEDKSVDDGAELEARRGGAAGKGQWEIHIRHRGSVLDSKIIGLLRIAKCDVHQPLNEFAFALRSNIPVPNDDQQMANTFVATVLIYTHRMGWAKHEDWPHFCGHLSGYLDPWMSLQQQRRQQIEAGVMPSEVPRLKPVLEKSKEGKDKGKVRVVRLEAGR